MSEFTVRCPDGKTPFPPMPEDTAESEAAHYDRLCPRLGPCGFTGHEVVTREVGPWQARRSEQEADRG